MTFANTFGAKFILIDAACLQPSEFVLLSFGFVQDVQSSHSLAGWPNNFGFAHNIGLAAESYHFIALVLKFEKSWCLLVIFGMLRATGARKPMMYSIGFDIDIIDAKPIQSSLVLFPHLWFYHFLQTGPRNGHVCAVRVHLTIFEIGSVHIYIHKVKIKLKHTDIGIL